MVKGWECHHVIRGNVGFPALQTVATHAAKTQACQCQSETGDIAQFRVLGQRGAAYASRCRGVAPGSPASPARAFGATLVDAPRAARTRAGSRTREEPPRFGYCPTVAPYGSAGP